MVTKCEIKYQLIDVTAKTDMSPTSADKETFSDPTDLKGDVIETPNFATLENNRFILDGQNMAFTDTPSNYDWGLWSHSLSDENGDFSDDIELTIQFTDNHSSVGLELYFDDSTGDYPSDITVSYYDYLDTLISSKDYTPKSAVFFCDGQANDYRKIVISFAGTNKPYRRIKLRGIIFGGTMIFGEDSLIDATLLEEVDATSAELSINTLDFTIHTDAFDLLDPQGLYTLLQKRQPLDVTEYIDGAPVDMGRYYLTTPTCESNNITKMECVDFIGIMDLTRFKGGIYNNTSIDSIISEIMTSAGGEYELDASYTGTLTGYVPICTHREALQQVAIAIGAIVDTSRGNKVYIYPVPTDTSGTIPYARKIKHKVTQEQLITGVEVTAHNYVQSSASTQIYKQSLAAGDYTIEFDAPYASVTASGATITSSGVNYANIHVASSTTVTLTGYRYEDNTSLVGYYSPSVPANAEKCVLSVDTATLVSVSNAGAVAQRIYDLYAMRYTTDGGIILNNEEVGQKWDIETLNDHTITGIVEKLETDLTGGFISKIKIRGANV